MWPARSGDRWSWPMLAFLGRRRRGGLQRPPHSSSRSEADPWQSIALGAAHRQATRKWSAELWQSPVFRSRRRPGPLGLVSPEVQAEIGEHFAKGLCSQRDREPIVQLTGPGRGDPSSNRSGKPIESRLQEPRQGTSQSLSLALGLALGQPPGLASIKDLLQNLSNHGLSPPRLGLLRHFRQRLRRNLPYAQEDTRRPASRTAIPTAVRPRPPATHSTVSPVAHRHTGPRAVGIPHQPVPRRPGRALGRENCSGLPIRVRDCRDPAPVAGQS